MRMHSEIPSMIVHAWLPTMGNIRYCPWTQPNNMILEPLRLSSNLPNLPAAVVDAAARSHYLHYPPRTSSFFLAANLLPPAPRPARRLPPCVSLARKP